MPFFEILLIAISLSMDSFAFSMTSGIIIRRFDIRLTLRIALYMAIFQALMPLFGWLLGFGLKSIIQDYDHWIAFGLLTSLGIKMIYDDFWAKASEPFDPTRHAVLFAMAIATSIDALIIGLNFAFLGQAPLIPSLTIGTTCFKFSGFGVYLGAKIGNKTKLHTVWIGGAILIALGIKILYEHIQS